jgi:hypothetical protein
MKDTNTSQEVSRSLISITNMSTCCKVLEIIFNRELTGTPFLCFDSEVLTSFNDIKSKIEGPNFKSVSQKYISDQINLLKKLGFIDRTQLTPLGKKVASRCANGEYDSIVSYNFFKKFYQSTTFYRDTISKIRDGKYDLDEIIEKISQLHGLNNTASPKLKQWIQDLNFTFKEGNIIKFDPLFEKKALEWNSLSEFYSFLISLNLNQETSQERNLYSEIDLNFFNGTVSNSTISKIIMKMNDDNYLTINRGKNYIHYIKINDSISVINTTLQKYLLGVAE